MAYTVTQLITNAFYVSGIVSREFQTVSGTQVNDGLQLVNEIITDKYADKGMIPYYTKYDFNVVKGQEQYFIPGLIEIETLVFFLNDVRFSMKKNSRINYFGCPRATNIESLPWNWHFERQLGGGSIYLYFLPDENYPLQAWGQFGLSEVSLGQDLTLTYDDFYISYLKYAVADRICVNYNYETPPGVGLQLKKYELMISKQVGPLDLSMKKISTLGTHRSLNYAQANIGKSWTV